MTAPAASASRLAPAVSLAAVAWILVVALFILLRVGLVWRAPVGGAELDHLAGAWQAGAGVGDERYVPTLYQSAVSLTLNWTESERPARLLALAGTLTIPLALFLLRRSLGEGGALFALLLLTLDPLGLVLGVTATAAAWDSAIALWLVIALVASRPPPWGWLLLAFLTATSGPITLPVVLAAIVVAARRRERPSTAALAWGALGALLGLALASVQFGLGADGLRIPPVILFVTGFEETWSTLSVAALAPLYALPLLVGGVAAAGWLAAKRRAAGEPPTAAERLVLATAAFAFLWFLVALPTHSPFPLAAAALFSCVLLGPALAHAAGSLLSSKWEWGLQTGLVLFVFALAAIALFALSGWAALERINDHERVLIAMSLFAIFATVSSLALSPFPWFPERLPLALLPILAAGGVLLLAGVSGVALSAAGEPLPGPVSPASARAIRDAAIERTPPGGAIVIHARYREALTWPFRDSPGLVLSSGAVGSDASVVIWPLEAPPPEGFTALEGRWALDRAFQPPDGFFALVRWFAERNSLAQEQELVAIYVRSP